MSSQYVDGEEEQLHLVQPLIMQAKRELATLFRRPVPDRAEELLNWVAREAFRLGHQHAHDRNTLREDLWPDDEITE